MDFTYSLNEIKEVTINIWQAGRDYKVWALHGEMGGGKTTFIHSLCEMLGVTSAISSPTYSIINEYESAEAGTIFHMDWYRLKDEDEALQAGVEDVLFSENLCLIEWPEKAERLLPDQTFHLYISFINEQTRKISIGK